MESDSWRKLLELVQAPRPSATLFLGAVLTFAVEYWFGPTLSRAVVPDPSWAPFLLITLGSFGAAGLIVAAIAWAARRLDAALTGWRKERHRLAQAETERARASQRLRDILQHLPEVH